MSSRLGAAWFVADACFYQTLVALTKFGRHLVYYQIWTMLGRRMHPRPIPRAPGSSCSSPAAPKYRL